MMPKPTTIIGVAAAALATAGFVATVAQRRAPAPASTPAAPAHADFDAMTSRATREACEAAVAIDPSICVSMPVCASLAGVCPSKEKVR